MRTFISLQTIVLILCIPSYACTIFTASSEGLVLVGNEEDFYNYTAKVQITSAHDDKYGTVTFGFYDNPYIPFGGINSEGLFFDVAAYPERPEIIDQFPADLFTFTYQSGHSLFIKMLEECANVDEAIELLYQYNSIAYSWCHMLIADSSGASAVLEWGNGQLVHYPKLIDYQVATNFNFTDTSWGSFPCERYSAASNMLLNASDFSIPLFFDILGVVHKANAIYSNIYDLINGEIYVLQYHDSENYIRLNVNNMLEMGDRTVPLSILFSRLEVFQVCDLTDIDHNWGNENLTTPLMLNGNYPNPFNPSTTLKYDLSERSDVSMIIYDGAGREVTTLLNQILQPGHYETPWNGRDVQGRQLTSGIYFAKLQAGDHSSVVKMVFLR